MRTKTKNTTHNTSKNSELVVNKVAKSKLNHVESKLIKPKNVTNVTNIFEQFFDLVAKSSIEYNHLLFGQIIRKPKLFNLKCGLRICSDFK